MIWGFNTVSRWYSWFHNNNSMLAWHDIPNPYPALFKVQSLLDLMPFGINERQFLQRWTTLLAIVKPQHYYEVRLADFGHKAKGRDLQSCRFNLFVDLSFILMRLSCHYFFIYLSGNISVVCLYIFLCCFSIDLLIKVIKRSLVAASVYL